MAKRNNNNKQIIAALLEFQNGFDKENGLEALEEIARNDFDFWVYSSENDLKVMLVGINQEYLECIVGKMVNEFGIKLSISNFEVMYKTAIKSGVKSEGRFIRQASSRDSYGHCWIEFQPESSGEEYEFVNKIIDNNVIPVEYADPIKQGIKRGMLTYGLGGYPITALKATLYDGSYNKTDSSPMCFKIAGFIALKEALSKVEKVLLEPIMRLRIEALKNDFHSIIAKMPLKRGRNGQLIMENERVIKLANVPMAEILYFLSQLPSELKEQIIVDYQFSHYEEVPSEIQEDIIANSPFQDAELIQVGTI